MLHALREYRLWLRENYADLEHKEVWQSFVLLAVFMLAGICYNINASSLMYEIVMKLIDIILIFVLLWRVETLQTLETHDSENTDASAPMNAVFTKIESALQLHCVESQLYLRHDVSLSHLAQIIGTNSKYLSQYFAHQGLTYNAYINGLRIKYFINHYKEANANKLFVTANQLASESGFRSYSTFSAAFKQYMGQTVTAWMRDNV